MQLDLGEKAQPDPFIRRTVL